MESGVKLSVAQTQCVVGDIPKNLNNIKKYVKKAVEDNSNFIIFGESALTGYTSNKENICFINKEDSIFTELKHTAKKGNINILFGANIIDNNNTYNSYICVDNNGEISYYNKTHLGKKEELIFKKGNVLRVFENSVMNFGCAVCIESHIPEIFTYYSAKGAEIVFVPFASPIVSGSRKDIWEKYLRARAYDNGIYIAAVNIVGDNGVGLEFSGGMMIVDPKGNVIDEYYDKKEKIITVEVSREYIRKIKSNKKNFFKYRRYELYNIDY